MKKPAGRPRGKLASLPLAPKVLGREGSDTQKETRVAMMVRISFADRKRLRALAVEQDTSLQGLLEEAIREFLRRES
jgi:predicted HicB family RNase H-like nuclease